jgi:hypothetical protein
MGFLLPEFYTFKIIELQTLFLSHGDKVATASKSERRPEFVG